VKPGATWCGGRVTLGYAITLRHKTLRVLGPSAASAQASRKGSMPILGTSTLVGQSCDAAKLLTHQLPAPATVLWLCVRMSHPRKAGGTTKQDENMQQAESSRCTCAKALLSRHSSAIASSRVCSLGPHAEFQLSLTTQGPASPCR
jgi:hypothetical protein